MPGRILHFVLLLAVAWCVMATTHEAGHLMAGWLGGGTLLEADLWPWHLPYSFFEPDPYPLATLWSGPLLGVALPLFLAALLRRPWGWFVAYFCLLANGLYLALAWISGDHLLDTPKLLAHGASPASIVLYCMFTIGIGYLGFRRECLRLFVTNHERNMRETKDSKKET